MRYLKRENGCDSCCKRGYKSRGPTVLIDDHVLQPEIKGDSVLEEALALITGKLIHSASASNVLKRKVAKQVAEYANIGATKMASTLWENPSERRKKTSLIAPFDLEEIILGKPLGVGGFSYVFEIQSFDANTSSKLLPVHSSISSSCSGSSSSSLEVSSPLPLGISTIRQFDREQKKARQFLMQHVMKSQEDLSQRQGGKDEQRQQQVNGDVQPRYALKHLRPRLVHRPEGFARAAKDLVREAEILLSLSHPNIIKLRGWSAGGPDAYSGGRHDSFFLIIDKMTETLEDRIGSWRRQWKKERSVFFGPTTVLQRCLAGKKHRLVDDKEPDLKPRSVLEEQIQVAHDLSHAVQYLHEQRIIHRDIKSTNAGFDIRGDIKLLDFGLARTLPESLTGDCQEDFHMSSVGTRRYAAPEVLSKLPYNLKADVYSFGITLWEILTMSTPTKTHKPKNGSGSPTRKPMHPCSCWPKSLQQLLSSMMAQNPTDRPTMTHTRTTLGVVLRGLSLLSGGQDFNSELITDADRSRRRRSTFVLEFGDLEGMGLKDVSNEEGSYFQSSGTTACSSLDEDKLTPGACL